MTDHNPFSTPAAHVADMPIAQAIDASKSKTSRYIIAALVAVQLLATLRYSWAYFELVRTGAAHALALMRIPTNVTACTEDRDRLGLRASVGFRF